MANAEAIHSELARPQLKSALRSASNPIPTSGTALLFGANSTSGNSEFEKSFECELQKNSTTMTNPAATNISCLHRKA